VRQFKAFRDGATAFAAWCGGDRDPPVAYLDAHQLVVGEAELTTHGWAIWPNGTAYTPSGWSYSGPIERSVLHRLAHSLEEFVEPGGCQPTDKLCAVAATEPPMQWAARFFAETGGQDPAGISFELASEYAVQLSADRDLIRRAVYADDKYVLEAGMSFDRSIRVWPCRAFTTHIASLAPTPAEATTAIERIGSTFRSRDIARR
jgi:hypothetical protein